MPVSALGIQNNGRQYTRMQLLQFLLLLSICLTCRAQAAVNNAVVQSKQEEEYALVRREEMQSKLPAEFVQLNQVFRGPTLPAAFVADAYDLSDVAIVSTVDGSLHAVSRQTGQWRWTLHEKEGSTDAMSKLGRPLVTTEAPSEFSLNSANNSQSSKEADEFYILEPAHGGAIFLHTRSTDMTVKLPLTISELVDISPFQFPGDNMRMFVGQRTTELLSLDLASGQLLGVFGSENGWCEYNKGIMTRDPTQEWHEDIQSRPRDLLYIGRTHYRLSIISQTTSEVLQKLSYTSYHPSSLNAALQQSTYYNSIDSRYFQPLHDGSLLCFKSGQRGIDWATTPFKSPVVGMFDILHESGTSAQPVLLRQPPFSVHRDFSIAQGALVPIQNSAYIGSVALSAAETASANATLYLLSPESFPLIAISSGNNIPEQECSGDQCLVGLHTLEPSEITGPEEQKGLTGPKELPKIDPVTRQPVPLLDAGPQESKRPQKTPFSLIAPSPYLPSSAFLVKLGMASLLALFIVWRQWKRRRQTITPRAVETTTEKAVGDEEIATPTKNVQSGPVFDQAVRNRQAILHMKLPSVDKDLPLLPLDTDEEDRKEVASPPEENLTRSDDESDNDAQNPKRKPRGRRKRGKKPSQKNQNNVTPFADLTNEQTSVTAGSLNVSDTVLGYGSHGTVVLKGSFQNRAVAVKRLLKDFVTIASHEVTLLQESDEHENVIRYFCKEQHGNFLYIALELCPASLADVIESPANWPELVTAFDPKRALRQIASGLAHLHRLKIIHRDIKPQNILVSLGQPQIVKGKKSATLRMLISDFGLCKKLGLDESSFLQTVNHAAGSFGYRAPEVLRGDVNVGESGLAPSSSSKSVPTDDLLKVEGAMKRLTRSIDIFSLGCIFYYVLTTGEHPFGGRFEREINILRGDSSLQKLDGMGEELHEAQDMVASMIASDPDDRPSAEDILLHPFFWTSAKRLNFLCEASDRFEIMERDPPDQVLVALEDKSETILQGDWVKRIDRSLNDNLGKYRKYESGSVRDLLRVVRNKRHHFLDLPENVRKSLGSPPDDFLAYFTQRFPLLFLHVWAVIKQYLAAEAMFSATYFGSFE